MTNEEVRAKLEQVIALTTTLVASELTPAQQRAATRVIDECGWALYYKAALVDDIATRPLNRAVKILDGLGEG